MISYCKRFRNRGLCQISLGEIGKFATVFRKIFSYRLENPAGM